MLGRVILTLYFGRLPVGRSTRSRGAFAFKKLIPSPSHCLRSAAVGGVAVDTRASYRDFRRDFVAPLSSVATPPGHRDSFGFSSSRLSNLSPVSSDVSSSLSFVDSHLRVRSTGLPNYLGLRISVPSALHVPHWRECLRDYPDRIICDYLQFGWPVGFVRDSLPVFDIRTHRGALNFPDMVCDYLAKELRLGRVAGPFPHLPFPDGYVLSPLNTVAKRDSDERRVILDLSWPCGSSVNDGIPSDSFLGDPMALTYPTLDDIVDAIVAAGPGCMLYKRDLRKAYRQFPVDPGDYHLLGFAWQGVYYFDTVLAMGLRSAAMACQRSTSAAAWVLRQRGHTMFNYLDDFIGVSPPSLASSRFQALGQLLTDLGLEESPTKACPPSTTMTCLGVELNTVALTMSVAPERLSEIEALLNQWCSRRTTTKSALQSLVGKLVFVSKCVRQSRVFIARILRLLRTARFNHHHVNLTADFRKDILWWRRFLREYNGVSMISSAVWSSPGEVFVTDACLTGGGGLCHDQYFHVAFPEGILAQSLDINCLELLTIVVALQLWGRRWSGLRLTVRCDNAVAVSALNSGRCRSLFLSACLREICYLAATYEFEIRAVHIPGEFNQDADLLSRWASSAGTPRQALFLRRAARDHLVDIPVPASVFDIDRHYWSSASASFRVPRFGCPPPWTEVHAPFSVQRRHVQ